MHLCRGSCQLPGKAMASPNVICRTLILAQSHSREKSPRADAAARRPYPAGPIFKLHPHGPRTSSPHLMNHSKLLRTLALVTAAQTLIVSVITAEPTVPNSPSSTLAPENPFAHESELPYHLPPFDKIKDSDFMPAIEAGMRAQLQEVEVVAADPAMPTFENTIVALERTGP